MTLAWHAASWQSSSRVGMVACKIQRQALEPCTLVLELRLVHFAGFRSQNSGCSSPRMHEDVGWCQVGPIGRQSRA